MQESHIPWASLPPRLTVQKLIKLGLYLNSPERAIICTRCQYALQPAGETVSKHLWEKHGTSQDEREGLNAFVRSLRMQDPNTLPLRAYGSTQHPHLRLQAGLACQECDYTTTSDHLIRRHINQTHSQVARADKRHHCGRLWTRVMLQSWTQSGRRSFWIVRSPNEGAEEVDLAQLTPRRRARVQNLLEFEARRREEHDEGYMIKTSTLPDFVSQNNWMRRTEWTKTFAGVDLMTVLRMADLTYSIISPVTRSVTAK